MVFVDLLVWAWELGIGEAAERNRHQLRLPRRIPERRCTALAAEVVLDRKPAVAVAGVDARLP